MSTEVLDVQMMLESLRVAELRSLLSTMGMRKAGLKAELIERIKVLLQVEDRAELLTNIKELYKLRYKDIKSQRHSEIARNACKTSSSPDVIGAPRADCFIELNKMDPKPAPEVQMIKHPLYQTLDTVLAPAPLKVSPGSPLQRQLFFFELTAAQLEQIKASKECQPGVKTIQVVLRFCYTDTVGIEEDQYPPNIAIKVNSYDCPIEGCSPPDQPGVEPQRPCKPVNITPLLPTFTSVKYIEITWGNIDKRYSMAVYLARLMTPAELLSQLQDGSVETVELCKQRICEKLRCEADTEVPTIGLQVSLICPLTKQRLSVPCRAVTCAHLQCFDAVFYLQMNERKPKWICPVCHKPALFDQLRIDGLLQAVLRGTEDDVEEIEYLPDGSWRSVSRRRERQHSRTPDCHPLVSSDVMTDDDVIIVDLTQDSSDDM